MMTFVLEISWWGIVLASGIYLWKIFSGESAAEKAIAFDGAAISLTCLIAILCIRLETLFLYDAILIFCLLGFLGTFAVAKYIEKGEIF